MSINFPKSFHRFRLRKQLVSLTYLALFNTAFAFLFSVGLGGGFWENMVFAMCIGGMAFLLIKTGLFLLSVEDCQLELLPYVVVVVISCAIAFVLGMMLAGWLLGIPTANMTSHVLKHSNIYVAFLLIAFGTTSIFFWNRGKIAALQAVAAVEKTRTETIQRQAMQTQLQLLQAQIEPHMLFNTLANLQELIAIDPSRAQQMLDQLIQYLRATLSSSRAEKTTLAQEFSLMEAYLGLMSVRMGQRLTYALDLPQELGTLAIPPMLLQPLVENAIKHGLEPKVNGGRIDVSARREDGKLTLSVSDSGLGLDTGVPHAHGTHLGLANIRERLQVLYGERARLSLTPAVPYGVLAQIDLPG